MDTLERPGVRPGRTRRSEIVGTALLAVGFVLMVLGIYEIGGLLSLGCGLFAIQLGEVVIFAAERPWYVRAPGYPMPPGGGPIGPAQGS